MSKFPDPTDVRKLLFLSTLATTVFLAGCGLVNKAGLSITAVSPTSGSVSGGTPLTITGSLFEEGTTVTVGGSACTSVVLNSNTQLTCTSPAHEAGTVDVAVMSADNTIAILTGGYTYTAADENPPSVTSVSPTSGSTVGGTSITIVGSNFLVGAAVTVGGLACTSISVNSASNITCVTPAGAAGASDITVTNIDSQSGTLVSGFTFVAPPAIVSINPSSGSTSGSTSVVITGTGFSEGATVTVGGSACTSVSVNFSTQITCVTPSHSAGLADVVVTNSDSQDGSLVNGYTYVSPPTVTGISSTSGTTGGSTMVTITGTGFETGALVYRARAILHFGGGRGRPLPLRSDF